MLSLVTITLELSLQIIPFRPPLVLVFQNLEKISRILVAPRRILEFSMNFRKSFID